MYVTIYHKLPKDQNRPKSHKNVAKISKLAKSHQNGKKRQSMHGAM